MADTDTQAVQPQELETHEQKPEGNIPASISVSEAARLLGSWSRNKSDPEAEGETEPDNAQLEGSEARADDAQAEKPQGEEQEAEAETPIEPPSSWSRDEKQRFQSLPRETQEYLATRESERDKALNRSQQDAAEQRKAFDAERQKVEQARQQYESALPQLLQVLQSQQQGEFSDVKTIADVERLAREDWPRYLQWDVAQKKMAAVQQEMLGAQQRQSQEKSDKFREFASKEDEAFANQAIEAKDAKAFEKLQKGAVSVLRDLGFSDSELGESWNGSREFSLRDHRVQLLIRDAYLYREEQAAKKTAATTLADKKAPAPKVQRPGTAQPVNAAQMSRIKDLQQQLGNARGSRATQLAADLWEARTALQK